ncbi:MAG: hypothetical protein HZB70_00335 [Candidatus Berkelbacteria bacterium]|nr:MAG: hypothetical protein HZB70_00335 [Candidatus Berkelbacteria bacterium]QQG52159.1 MAG: hypothetical protein HY845_02665 [Candidatus Berkelbacteria bacterium]
MKRIYAFLAILAVSAFAMTAHASPRLGVRPLNYKIRNTQAYKAATLPQKIEMTGKSDKGAAELLDDAFGCQHWRHDEDVEEVGYGTIPPANPKEKNFANTGLDRNGKPLAYADARAYAVSYTTVVCKRCPAPKPVDVKDDCINTLPRNKEQAKRARKLPPSQNYYETTNETEILDVDIDVRASATAIVNNDITASAATAPITINITGPAAAPVMAFAPLQNQFSWHSTSNSLISGSMSFARPGDINIWNKVISVNNNSNANTNVLNNVNNIVTGNGSSGSASGSGAGSSTAGSGNGGGSPEPSAEPSADWRYEDGHRPLAA